MDQLEQRIRLISKELGLSHIGSNVSALPVLKYIYEHKQPEDVVVLDNSHAHLSHLVVREAYEWNLKHIGSVEDFIKNEGIHCDRKAGCDASGGSLGHGIGISIGMALADRSRTVHCMVSDGSMMEGSNWEALRVRHSLKLKNLRIYCNFNGYSAVQRVELDDLMDRMIEFDSGAEIFYTDNGEGLKGIKGHYKTL
jgi:transketolase